MNTASTLLAHYSTLLAYIIRTLHYITRTYYHSTLHYSHIWPHYSTLLAYITTLLYITRMHSSQPPPRSLGNQRRKRTRKADTTDAADVTEACTALKHATHALPCASLAPIDNRGGWWQEPLVYGLLTGSANGSFAYHIIFVLASVRIHPRQLHWHISTSTPLSIFTPASLGYPLLVFQGKNKLYSPTHVCSIFSC